MQKRFLILSSQVKPNLERIAKKLKEMSTDEIDVLCYSYKDVQIIMGDNGHIEVKLINGTSLEDFSLVYFRYERHSYGIADALKCYLQYKNIDFISTNRNSINRFGNKLIQNINFCIHKLPIPKSYYQSTKSLTVQVKNLIENLNFPIIMKDVDGQKGNLNFKVNSEAEVIFTLAQHANTNFIYQEFIPNDFDYRIVVLGQSRIGSIDKRTRQNLKDHRNNVALGATEFFIEPNEFEGDDLKKLAIDASIACGVEVAGVDIVLSTRNNKAYLMEINSSPGFTQNTIEEESVINYLYSRLNDSFRK